MREGKLSTGEVGVLLYADGMVLMAESEERLQSNLQILSEAMVKRDLKVNWKKTKMMKVARERGDCKIRVGDQAIEQVDEIKYLGVMLSSDGMMQNKIEAKLGAL